MTWNLSVPKIFHVYWGGGVLPYLRYLTVKSFQKLNSDWKIILWIPKIHTKENTWNSHELEYPVNCKDYYSELLKLDNVHEVDFEDMGFKNTASEAHKSDFLRMYLLYTVGGIWSDTDIIYFKPITTLEFNIPENSDKETFVCICHYGHSVGFIMSAKGSVFYKKMSEVSGASYNPNDYQCLGSTMFNKYFPTLATIEKISPAINMKMDVVYSHDADHIKELLTNRRPNFTDNSIGCHWYAGHKQWGAFFESTNGGLSNLPDSIISKLCAV
jgi:hypothetical protein